MRRYELSPGKLREMKEKLVREGYLESDHVGHDETKRTRTCPSCSEEIPQNAGKCVHCGAWLDAEPSEGHALRQPRQTKLLKPCLLSMIAKMKKNALGKREPTTDHKSPFHDRYRMLDEANEVLFQPSSRRRLPEPDSLCRDVRGHGVVLGYMWTSLFSGGLLGLVGLLFLMAFVFVASLITLPIIILAFSALLHGSLCLVKGANEGFQTTFRVVSYSWVTTLFNALPIPYVGNIASLWGLVLMAIGLKETHKTSTGKAASAVLISVAVVGAVLAIFFAGALSAALSGTKTQRPRTFRKKCVLLCERSLTRSIEPQIRIAKRSSKRLQKNSKRYWRNSKSIRALPSSEARLSHIKWQSLSNGN